MPITRVLVPSTSLSYYTLSSSGDHLRQVCAAMHSPLPTAGGTNLPSHLHSQGHASGGKVRNCIADEFLLELERLV